MNTLMFALTCAGFGITCLAVLIRGLTVYEQLTRRPETDTSSPFLNNKRRARLEPSATDKDDRK